MRLGLTISLLVHATLLAWAVLTIQQTPELRTPDVVTISVAVVTPSEVTRKKQGDETTKTLESKAADKPADTVPQPEVAKPKPPPPAAAPPPPAPESPPPEPPKPEPPKAETPPPPKPDPIAEKLAEAPPPEPTPPEPAPGPTPEELAAQEAARKAAEAAAKAEAERKRKEADAKRKAEAERKRKEAEAKRKADEKRRKELEAKLAQAIDQAPDAPQKALIDKSNRPAGTRPQGDSQTATNTGPSAGTRDGRDTVLSAREADMLVGLINARLMECWRLPAGGGGTTVPTVVLSWRLKPDGMLDGEPRVVRTGGGPLAQVATEAAIRAVKTCAPFQLPPDKYANWREITDWAFDPSKMVQ